jgi:hypothetical protein
MTFKKPTQGQVKRGTIAALGVAAFCAVAPLAAGPLLAVAILCATGTLMIEDKDREDDERRNRELRDSMKAANDGLGQHGFNAEAYLPRRLDSPGPD